MTNTINKKPIGNGHNNNNNNNNNNIQNSNIFKIRAIARDIRPSFIQVLKIPEFRNCVAAQEIRNQMKLMMDLYKEMMAETISVNSCIELPESQTPLASETLHKQKLKEGGNTVVLCEIPQLDDSRPHGTYIVGGSAVGWSFITYMGGKPVYYGRTKEMFRAENLVVKDVLPKG